MRKVFTYLSVLRFWPHILMALCKYDIIRADVEAYRAEYAKQYVHDGLDKDGVAHRLYCMLFFLTYNKSYRSLFYYRIGKKSILISWLAPGMPTLSIPRSAKIGTGVLLFHSYGTILNARQIGDHCRIVCNITLGDKKGKTPIIGNFVEILPGAVITGDVTIGDHCVIGPNAVVFKSVPANCVVVGNPAYILKENGKIVNRPL